jgi:DNA-directed RNA polymerase specialized sigma24 family protein
VKRKKSGKEKPDAMDAGSLRSSVGPDPTLRAATGATQGRVDVPVPAQLPFPGALLQSVTDHLIQSLLSLQVRGSDVEDVAQKVLLALLRKVATGVKIRDVERYVAARAPLAARNYHRRNRRELQRGAGGGAGDAEAGLEGLEEAGGTVRAWHGQLLDLTEKQVREVMKEKWKHLTELILDLLMLRHFRGKTVAQIAALKGWTIDQAKKKLAKLETSWHSDGGIEPL